MLKITTIFFIFLIKNPQVQPHKIIFTGSDPDGTSLFPVIALDGVQVDLRLKSPLQIGKFGGHSDSSTLTTDVNGNVLILTNTIITGMLIGKGENCWEINIKFISNLEYQKIDVLTPKRATLIFVNKFWGQKYWIQIEWYFKVV